MSRGNPNFIAAGWGEATKPFKLPIRVGERIQELRESGEDADSILDLLNAGDQVTEQNLENLDEVTEILREALHLKSNAGGAIKAKIRQVLELLNAEEK